MTTGVLALVTFGVCLALLFVAVLAGEAIYHWVLPRVLPQVLPRLFDNKPSGKGSKRVGDFELGEQDISEGVEALMKNIGHLPVERCLERHRAGDWGELDDENRHLNSLSLGEGGSLGFESAYRMEDGTVLRIFTFEDCSGTLLLTGEEYHRALLPMDKESPQENGALYVRSLEDYLAGEGPSKED